MSINSGETSGPFETCVRCHCPECERERALIWKMVEILIFEAGQARGLSHKVDPLIVAWKHKDLFRKDI